MSATVQPRLKIGIAVAGASAIALAPIIQPMPDIAEPLARSVSTAAVALSATTNPIEQWLQIINTAVANGGALAQTYLANPAPILRQLILNGIGYGEQTFTALQSTVTALIDNLRFDNPSGLPMNLKNAWDQILAGDIANGLPALYGAFSGYLLFSAFPLLNLLEIPGTMAQNFANVVEAGMGGRSWARLRHSLHSCGHRGSHRGPVPIRLERRKNRRLVGCDQRRIRCTGRDGRRLLQRLRLQRRVAEP